MKADILAWQLEKAVTKINAHCLVQTDTKKQFQGCKLERECVIDKRLKERRISIAGGNGKDISHKIRRQGLLFMMRNVE